MNLKQFIKPDWKKIILTVIFAIQFFYIWYSGIFALLTHYYPSQSELILVFLNIPVYLYSFFIHRFVVYIPYIDIGIFLISFLLSIFYWYIISCIIVQIYDKSRGEKK